MLPHLRAVAFDSRYLVLPPSRLTLLTPRFPGSLNVCVIDTSTAAGGFAGYGVLVTTAEPMRGAALLQRGAEDLVAVAGGTTGSEPDADCTLGTRFQVASVSKQFTAAAVLLLADRGVLSVEDPVCDWLDGCPAAWEPITVHHLLSHTSGLVHWYRLPGLDQTRPMAASELVARFASVPLLGRPGGRFSYSSPGFVLLGAHRGAGRRAPYRTFLAREIFQPLGLTATFSGNPGGEPGLAAGRQARRGGAFLRAGYREPGHWEHLVHGRGSRPVGPRPRQRRDPVRRRPAGHVHGPRARRDDDGVIRTEGYGYGWYIGTASGGRRIFYHPGDQPGFRSLNAWFPDDDVRLAVLSNEAATASAPSFTT